LFKAALLPQNPSPAAPFLSEMNEVQRKPRRLGVLNAESCSRYSSRKPYQTLIIAFINLRRTGQPTSENNIEKHETEDKKKHISEKDEHVPNIVL
ncbi:hypothetical protein KUCAC02_033239, partial [Chaenocephalus aceratus]